MGAAAYYSLAKTEIPNTFLVSRAGIPLLHHTPVSVSACTLGLQPQNLISSFAFQKPYKLGQKLKYGFSDR